MLSITNLSASFDGKVLLSDINLNIKKGARHLIRGRNGSGKTSLAQIVAGNPDYKIDTGKIVFNKKDITNESPAARALLGIFIGAQNVPEIPGLTWTSFLKHSSAAHHQYNTGKDLSMAKFLSDLEIARARLDIPKEWLNRSVNEGFSGGERKRMMFLRLLLANPKLAVLDEPDSGADASAQKLFAEIINEMPDTTFIIISHQDKFTGMIPISDITTLSNGKIVVE
jgi:Fe-S cluster assembly ATP-binding protein